MKKTIFVTAIFVFAVLLASAQDYNIGIRLTPLNSASMIDNMTGSSQGFPMTGYMENRIDSLTAGLSFQKYLKKAGLLLKADISYASYKASYIVNQTSSGGSTVQSMSQSQSEFQKCYNVNLGLGNRLAFGKFIFSFGGYIPFTILPKGSITRKESETDNGVLQMNTDCTGTYKGTLMFGIGSFADISTTLLKHLTIGVDFTYQIQYLSRNLDWTGTTTDYTSMPPVTDVDHEKVKIKSYYTSKITPSLLIEYTFDGKGGSATLFQ